MAEWSEDASEGKRDTNTCEGTWVAYQVSSGIPRLAEIITPSMHTNNHHSFGNISRIRGILDFIFLHLASPSLEATLRVHFRVTNPN